MKLLTMINKSPWNELILISGSRDKKGGNVIKHRGLILLYTSKSTPDSFGMDELLGLKDDPEIILEPDTEFSPPRGFIVGTAMLRDCKGRPGDVAYDISDGKRFPKPVPFLNRGAVRWTSISVTEEIEQQLRSIGVWKEASKANRELSINPFGKVKD